MLMGSFLKKLMYCDVIFALTLLTNRSFLAKSVTQALKNACTIAHIKILRSMYFSQNLDKKKKKHNKIFSGFLQIFFQQTLDFTTQTLQKKNKTTFLMN